MTDQTLSADRDFWIRSRKKNEEHLGIFEIFEILKFLKF